ncbi:MAG: T9SS type A sorting domain-containing protein, partial [Mariniphaga sp.]
LTATNACGNESCSFNVVVSDVTTPTALAKNITKYLDASGNTSIVAADIDNGSTDNCSIATRAASKTSFSCSDKGTNNVILTVTDAAGNSASANSVVTIMDAINPLAIAKNISVTLNPLGTATITAANINNGSYDNCSFTLTANKTSFACADLGANTVRLTATDASGNTATANSTVTVVEGTALPSSWVSCVLGASNGIGAYTPCTGPGRFTLTSTGYSSPSADVQESVYQTLNGNGSVVAHIYDLSGNGWAGIQIREDCSPGAKKVLIKTQLQTMIRSDIRNTTGGSTVSTQILRAGVKWLKISRTGNRFDAFTSTDGVGWMSAFTTTITMGASAQFGMISEGINFTSTTQARYDHCSVSAGAKSVEAGIPNQVAANEINIYPNPATDHVTIEIPEITGKVKCSVYSTDGKMLHSEMVEQVTTVLDVSYLKPGVYILRFDSDGEIVTKRLVVY